MFMGKGYHGNNYKCYKHYENKIGQENSFPAQKQIW